MVGGHGHEPMLVAGVIEIIAGLGSFKPKFFAVVSAWLLMIVVNLLMIPGTTTSRYGILVWRWALSPSRV
jgi:hypothetical protein